MTTFIFENNVSTTLASALSSTATSITLASSVNLPASIPLGSYFSITLNDAATRNVYEVCYATAISGNTLNVLRGQEGTVAQSWLVGDYAFSTVTAGQMQALESAFMANPMTTTGDLITATTGGAPVRLAAGANGYILTATGAGAPLQWSAPNVNGVTSFNSRTGAVTLASGDVTNALGYVPFSSAGGTIGGATNINGGLSISGSITASGNIVSNGSVNVGGAAWVLANSAGTFEFTSSNGVVGTLSATGDFVAVGTIQGGSDRRVKVDIVAIRGALETVRRAFVGCEYQRIDLQCHESGFIADDVQWFLPHLVSEHRMNGFDDFKTLDYMHILPYLANAIIELHDQVMALQDEISKLRTS